MCYAKIGNTQLSNFNPRINNDTLLKREIL